MEDFICALGQSNSKKGRKGRSIRVYGQTVVITALRTDIMLSVSLLYNNGVEIVTSCSNVPNLSLNILSSGMVPLTIYAIKQKLNLHV